MKYIEKPKAVEIEKYELGKEDGFIRPGEYIDVAKSYKPEMLSEKYPRYLRVHERIVNEALIDKDTYWKPFIINKKGDWIKLELTDFIVTEPDGNRFIANEEYIKEHYIRLPEQSLAFSLRSLPAVNSNQLVD